MDPGIKLPLELGCCIILRASLAEAFAIYANYELTL
jgi:hypothetical protein